MKTHVVTSFSMKGYRLYGAFFIESFHMFWPDVDLLIYIEGSNKLPILKQISNDKIKVFDLLLESPACKNFIDKNEHALEMHGKKKLPNHVWKQKDVESGYNYRYDAYKFARKSFAIEAALKIATDRLIWIDADAITYKKLPLTILDEMLPANKACSFLGRKRVYSECGFIGYNLAYPKARRLIEWLSATYSDDSFRNFAEWHDSYVWDKGRERIMTKDDWHLIPSKMDGEPFESCPISPYMSHLKGLKKYAASAFWNKALRGMS